MNLTSPAFKEGQSIPAGFTCDGEDVSPALQWDDPPPKTQSFALLCEDPDAPRGTWVHWVVFNIPASERELKEGQPKADRLLSGAVQGMTDFRSVGYGGPCPPSGTHRYFFRLYALDTKLPITLKAAKSDLLKAMEGHTLAKAELMGTYKRR